MSILNGSVHHNDPQIEGEGATQIAPLGRREGIGPRLIVSDLTPADHAALEARWVDQELAVRAQLRRVDSLTGGEIVGRRGGDYSGILIPYFQPGSDQVRDYRLRRDHPDLEYDAGGSLKAKRKYLSPPGRSNMLYLPPRIPQSLLRDSALPIMITEGEFKTLALWRAAHHGPTSQPRFLPLGLSGVYNWRGNDRKNGCPRWQQHGCEGSDSGSRLHRLGRAPGCDRL